MGIQVTACWFSQNMCQNRNLSNGTTWTYGHWKLQQIIIKLLLRVYVMINLNQWLVSDLIIQIHEDTVFLSMPLLALNFYFNSLLRSKVLALLMKGAFSIGSGQCQSKQPSQYCQMAFLAFPGHCIWGNSCLSARKYAPIQLAVCLLRVPVISTFWTTAFEPYW